MAQTEPIQARYADHEARGSLRHDRFRKQLDSVGPPRNRRERGHAGKMMALGQIQARFRQGVAGADIPQSMRGFCWQHDANELSENVRPENVCVDLQFVGFIKPTTVL